MQHRFDITPLVGVGPARLGASRAAVRAAMGSTPFSFRKGLADDPLTDAWFENSFQVFYEPATDTAEFIELSRGGPVTAMFRGHDLFATPASDLVTKLDQVSSYDRESLEQGYSFVFQEWQLSLWRPVLPEDDEEDARFFAAVGAGVSGYFKRPLPPISVSKENG